MGFAEDHRFNVRWLKEACRILKPDGTIWVTGTHHIIFSLGFALQKMRFKIINLIVWQGARPRPQCPPRCFHPLERGSVPPFWRLPLTSRPHVHPCRSLLVAPRSAKQGVVTLFARWASVRTSAHIYAATRHVVGEAQTLSVRERSPDIFLDGVMQCAAYQLPRTRLRRSSG
jgi:hypothetical protein